MKAQLKRKIAGVFEADMAYQILTSCDFGAAVKTNITSSCLRIFYYQIILNSRYYRRYKLCMATILSSYKLYNLMNQNKLHN
ncbi:hypothetical protein OTSGILL_1728 [Orientia tsutsugamushi str. Gilliam]|uniref:Uncharacterized protein n=1 Tax=Orientia tsutsugamushi str. Gilliam TaxID=1359184 RepID=A0A0F3M947_ORITS|nr:hypothetical protein OTSGILL_1728 [Orientia tsutsugamushi str. Gilliam]